MVRRRLTRVSVFLVAMMLATLGQISPARKAFAAPSPECPSPTVVGTDGVDRLAGTSGRDVIDGRGGNDDIAGLGGDDLICGGDGDDRIVGGAGADQIFGGAGADKITGDDGDDRIDAGAGNDAVVGGVGSDRIAGGDGDDVIDAGDGDDRCDGGGGTNDIKNCEGAFDIFRVMSTSPENTEDMVNVTREAVVRFNDVVDPATITDQSMQVVALGGAIAGRRVVSSTGLFVSFFPAQPWPASTEVRLTVDGNMIKNRAGTTLDADGDGQPGGVRKVDFTTLPLTRIPGTNVFGFVKDSYTTTPIVGATIRVDAFPEANAVTDSNGRFELANMPAPEFFVHIDGSTATGLPSGKSYPVVGKPFHSVPGQTVQLSMDGAVFDVHLPPMSTGDIKNLSPTATTNVSFGAGGVAELASMFPNVDPATWARMSVAFAPKAAVDDLGRPATQALVIPVPPQRLPAPLPPTVNPKLVISIQAIGATTFDVPAPVTFPNLEGLKPGEKSLLMSFNHDAGRWEFIGNGTVSADGLTIVSDPGVGVRAPGWHFTVSGSIPIDRPGVSHSDQDGGSLLDAAFCVSPPGQVGFLASQAAALYVKSKFGDFGSQLGIDHMNHFLDGSGSARNYADGSSVSQLVENGPEFARSNTFVQDYVRKELDRIIAAGGTSGNVGVPLEAARDRLNLESHPDLFFGIHGTQGVELTGSVDVVGSEYVGTLTYKYLDSYGFGQEDTWFAKNNITYQGKSANTLMRYLQTTCGAPWYPAGAHWFPVSVTVKVPFRKPATLPIKAEQAFSVSAAAPTVPVSNTSGFGSDPSVYYRYFLDNGLELAGVVNLTQPLQNGAVSPNVDYRAMFYAPSINASTSVRGNTGPSGTLFGFEGRDLTVSLNDFGGFDSDGDGLPDVGELAIGTDKNKPDTDADGITDGAEIAQGLNPLDNRGFPTGVISKLPLQGSAQALAVENDTVLVATGSYGLAIVDGASFNSPALLGQIDLPGSATDVGVDLTLKRAAVATGASLELVDVTDPMTPKVAQSVPVAATQVEVFGGFAYVASVTSVSAVDMATGKIIHQVTVPGSGTITQLGREGERLYAYVSGSDLLVVLDISLPEAFRVTGQLAVSIASSNVGLFAGNDIVWLVGSGLRSVDVSNPASPRLIHGADSFFTARRAALNGSGLALVLPDGGSSVDIYDVSNPNDTDNFLSRFNLSGAAVDVVISRGIGYVATGAGLEVLNYRAFDTQGSAPTVTVSTTAADRDPSTPGIQVIEGTTVPVVANVSDDVQVRSVELIVNGKVQGTDVSFPFDFTTKAVMTNATGSVMSVQLRAVDTGGNQTTSATLSISVTPDIFPPTITSIDPGAGEVRGAGHTTVLLRFSEPIKPDAVNATTFNIINAGPNRRFGDSDDVRTPIRAFALRDDDTLVQLTTDPLVVGLYQVRVDRSRISDVRGNVMGTGLLTSGFEIVKFVPVTITFNAGAGAPFSYTESGLTVKSGQDHLHMGDQNGDGSPDLLNHSSCCSTPYVFTYTGSQPFSVLSFDVVGGSAIGSGTLTSSNGGVFVANGVGRVTLGNAAWTNITSFSWDQASGDMIIDNLVISTAPSAAPAAASMSQTAPEPSAAVGGCDAYLPGSCPDGGATTTTTRAATAVTTSTTVASRTTVPGSTSTTVAPATTTAPPPTSVSTTTSSARP